VKREKIVLLISILSGLLASALIYISIKGVELNRNDKDKFEWIITDFAIMGQVWSVVDITNDDIIVMPSTNSGVVLPEWIGESIPVDKNIARDVWKLRQFYYKNQKNDEDKPSTPGRIIVPKDNEILVEDTPDIAIIHYPGGSKTNRTIGLILSKRIGELTGKHVNYVFDPYKIVLKTSRTNKTNITSTNIISILKDRNLMKKLDGYLMHSFLMQTVFQDVARLFGFIDEDTTLSNRYIAAMRHSIIFEEAKRYIAKHILDTDGAGEFFELIYNNKINIRTYSGTEPTYLGRLNTGAKHTDYDSRSKYERFVASIPRTVALKCTSCGHLQFVSIVLGGLESHYICGACGKDQMCIHRKNNPNRNIEADESALIKQYGKNAIIALVTKGVGVHTAKNILRKGHDTRRFLMELMRAQENYVRNSHVWRQAKD